MVGVLLVDADPSRAAATESALTAAGHAVTVVASGTIALTMLERARPDVVISSAQVDDMHAYELCAIVRSDPMTRGIPFLVLIDPNSSTPESVVQALAQLPAATESSPVAVTPADGPQSRGRESLSGACPGTQSLTSDVPENPELAEVFRAVTKDKKTGRLVACVGDAEGVLVFKAGRLVHAEFHRQRGEVAVTALLVAAKSGSAGRYRFISWDGSEVPKQTWGIDHDAEALLLHTYA